MSAKFTPLAEGFLVSPQIAPGDVDAAKALGVTLIINNRPDGEEPGQPASADIEKAARSAGLDYAAIPISGMGINPSHLDAFDEAIASNAAKNKGGVLAFCRSGTRSTVLRAYAEARAGVPVDDIIEEARQAGYNISGQRRALEALGGA